MCENKLFLLILQLAARVTLNVQMTRLASQESAETPASMRIVGQMPSVRLGDTKPFVHVYQITLEILTLAVAHMNA